MKGNGIVLYIINISVHHPTCLVYKISIIKFTTVIIEYYNESTRELIYPPPKNALTRENNYNKGNFERKKIILLMNY